MTTSSIFALPLVFTLIALPFSIALITRSKLSGRSSTIKMTFPFSDDRNSYNNDNGTSRRSLRLSERAAGRLETRQDSNNLETSKQLLTIGVLADIQHAPVPDGASWKGQPRYYEYALEQARTAAQHFQDEQVSLLINLGDIIDGKCASVIHGSKAIDSVLEALSVYTHGPILHTYGNHELYVLGREEIFHKLEIPFVTESPNCELVGYYSFVQNHIRFVVLDSYDIALMGRCPQTSVKRKEAEYWLSTNNPNYPSEENSPQGLRGLKQRFVAFNGAVGSAQLEWLRTTLRMAKSNKEKVIVLSHQPILPGSSSPLCLIWNYNDVLQILRQYSCTVMASFAGHAHRGGYARDKKSGIHFRVFESVLETPRPHTTYGFVDIHEDFLRVRGVGECNSAIYDFSHMSQSTMSS